MELKKNFTINDYTTCHVYYLTEQEKTFERVLMIVSDKNNRFIFSQEFTDLNIYPYLLMNKLISYESFPLSVDLFFFKNSNDNLDVFKTFMDFV